MATLASPQSTPAPGASATVPSAAVPVAAPTTATPTTTTTPGGGTTAADPSPAKDATAAAPTPPPAPPAPAPKPNPKEEAAKKRRADHSCLYSTFPDSCLDSILGEEDIIIEHTSDAVRVWDIFVLITTMMLVVLLPVRIGFLLTSVNEWLVFDLICDISYIVDIIIRTRRTFTEHGDTIRDVNKIYDQYVKSSDFVLDILSVLPIDFGSIALPEYRAAFLANRLLRVHRAWDALVNWEMVTSFKPSLVTMIKSLLLFYYAVHLDACVKHLILLLENNDAETRWMTADAYLTRNFWDRYWRAYYLSLVAASGFNSSTPTTPIECLVSIFDCIFSIAVFGVIIGVFGNLISNLDASRIFFFHQLDDANEYMRTQKLNKELVKSVNEYYSYLWSSGQALEKNQVLQKLPPSIRHNIAFHVTSSFIRKVPFFEEINKEEFFIEICKNLVPRTALPATYVVKKGEMGTEMYFVLRGELNVVLDNGTVVHTFTSGGFFGEIAIMYQIKRTATIIARTYCDVFVLGKNEFAKVLKKFPFESKIIRQVAEKRFSVINAGEKEKKEAEMKRREEELAAATRRAEQAAAENAALDNVAGDFTESGSSYDDDDGGNDNNNKNKDGDDDDDDDFTKPLRRSAGARPGAAAADKDDDSGDLDETERAGRKRAQAAADIMQALNRVHQSGVFAPPPPTTSGDDSAAGTTRAPARAVLPGQLQAEDDK